MFNMTSIKKQMSAPVVITGSSSGLPLIAYPVSESLLLPSVFLQRDPGGSKRTGHRMLYQNLAG